MSMNIANRLNLQQRQVIAESTELSDSSRNVGIEIEVERVNPGDLIRELGAIWEITDDGSLRPRGESAELRSPVPGYAGKALVDSIDALDNATSLRNASFSWRCANHFHIDMRDKTDEDLKMSMVLYSLIEPFIFAWDNTGRHESRFCMPWWVCSEDMFTAADMLTAKNNSVFRNLVMRFSKYTALNLAPLARFGTVEFRHSQATKDRNTIIDNINMCFDICNANERHPGTDPIEMVLEFMVDGPEPFIYKWFDSGPAAALTRQRIGEMPLTQDIFDRSINTALTIAELHLFKELSPIDNVNTDIIRSLL